MTVQKDVVSEESKTEGLVSDKRLSELDPEHTLLSDFRNQGAVLSCRELFFPSPHGFPSSIPKHITTLDEKYVLRCLELIRDYALRAEAWSVASKTRFLPNDFSDLAYLANEGSLVSGTNKFGNSSMESTLGSITDSPSMMNILKSPLLRQLGYDPNSGTTDFRHNSVNSFPHKSPKEATFFPDHRDLISPSPSPSLVHKRIISMSSTNSSCSDQSSTSVSAASFQGMLQCTWNNNGLPHHVFSVDDKREVYIADSCKTDSISGDKGLDYIYTFRLGKTSKKESDIMAAVMRVSSSISFGPKGSEIRETQYVLSSSNKEKPPPPQVSNLTNRKNNRSSIMRPSYMQKSFSKLSSAISEDTPWDPSEGACNRIDSTTNHELAAIIVKDISKNDQEPETGGWGLRFLKKSRSNSESNVSECSTSMDIVIPAGLHGGPKTRGFSGPSSLVERWISGGQCDCGGWDIGCPLTILSTELSSLDALSHPDNTGQCKSVEILIKGSKHDAPVLKMVNIHDGLFYIHFQSCLSSLQSFAIAAAVIHSRSSSLQL